ncbi:hypothetical protein L596_017338 [Steinernema carpocapsae]|uniref:Uncharacterized protein n=1 Tax=Steinernema carpocapsae TaxID=34508 RepID=A0A4U5N1M3_STECR|nr:hypothetical protein L596_017338 [Steinernema carpocapsae]
MNGNVRLSDRNRIAHSNKAKKSDVKLVPDDVELSLSKELSCKNFVHLKRLIDSTEPVDGQHLTVRLPDVVSQNFDLKSELISL